MQWQANIFGYDWYAEAGEDEFIICNNGSYWLAQWFSAGELEAETRYPSLAEAKAALEAMAKSDGL